jgi:hypothetical protein
VSDPLETLVEALLYEGYALYPYTPRATKNATPTPFGIVYPPAYAARSGSTFDHLELRCLLEGPPGTPVTGSVRFLNPEGGGHQAVARRVDLDRDVPEAAFEFPPLRGRATLAVAPAEDGLALVTLRVENATPFPPDLADRAEALRHALISVHPVLRAPGARFVSPLDAGDRARSVNTFPVLATDADDGVVGATIMLPDHPQIAPESLGDLFDGTEIEEALLLHVIALSDGERAEIADGDPAVRAMIERAERAVPEDIMRLHGRLRLEDR